MDEYENQIHFNLGGSLETTPSWVASVERHTTDARAGDVNEDGYPDVYFANASITTPSAIYYGGPGGPATIADWLSIDTMFSVGGGFGDIDGDGHLDLVQANQGTSTNPVRPVQVFFGDGGGVETSASYESADSTISNTVAIADLDRSDQVLVTGLALAANGVDRIFRLPHQPIDEFVRVEVVGGPTPRFTTDREIGRIHFATAPGAGTTVEVDYRHSPLPDVAFSRWVNYASAVYHNTGSGLPPTPTWDTGNVGATDRGAAFADPDADGDLDLALGNSGDPTVLWRNDAGVLATTSWSADSSLFFGTQEMAWGDVDADGDEDLATVHFGNGHLRVYLNRGGTLDTTPAWFYDFSTSATSLAWGDVNGDGFLDLAAGTARGPAVVFLNTSSSATSAPSAAGLEADRLIASPNPFRLDTAIRSAPGSTSPIEILDANGRTVRIVSAGSDGVAHWDGRNTDGRRVAAGAYFFRQGTATGVRSGRVIRLR